MKLIQNANQMPQRYFGLHMSPGVAEYQEKEGSLTILVNEDAIKKMDATFSGKPVYVDHVPEVDVSKVELADGFVVKSFYNAFDGKHWVEFMVVSDKGHEAIRKGWRLSNAYIPKTYATGGQWHGVTYQKEVTDGEYEHLAIVNNPRYDESVIYTADEFKAYNERKETELKRLANSKQGEKSVLKIFKKTKIENEADFDQMMVTLPKSKVDKTFAETVELADKFVNMAGYAAAEHMVKVNDDEEMSVGDMTDCYNKMKNAEKERVMKEEEEKMKMNKEIPEDKKEVAAEREEPQVGNALEKVEKDQKHFDALQNAEKNQPKMAVVDLDMDRIARGKARYGSGK